MKRIPALLLASGLVALAACTPANVKPGATVPTAIKAGQSWVVTRPVIVAQVLDTCSRESPARDGRVTGYWAPSRADVEQLESRLPALSPQVADPTNSNRQYVGVEIDGQRLVYINAFSLPDHADIDPSREAVRVCDGGDRFWGALFDPTTGEFSEIASNGR